jgi:WD40 repeat protein
MSDESEEISRDELLRRYQAQKAPAKAAGKRRSPFKFLDSYGVEDADIFFGRDYEIEELLQRFHGHGCVLIYGESGAGKSSLVQCGLRSRIPAEDALFLAPRVHGSGLPTICDQIYEQTAKLLDVPAEVPKDADLHSTLREVCDVASRPVVLFFDQFEELFIFHDKPERQAFAAALAAIPQQRLNVKVVIGVRQDYLAYLSELEDTVEGLFDNRFWLRRMARETAAKAVVQACAKGDVAIAEDVTAAILQRLDPAGEGVELPYLQVVMDRLFRLAIELNPENSSISIGDVEKLGDVANILGAFLVEEVGKLPAPETGRQILKAFVTSEGTRKSITRGAVSQEVAGFGGAIETEILDDYLKRLARVRILREVADTDTFELRHDALAATVAGWITEVEKELIEVRDNVLNRFREWEARSKPESALLDNDFLDYLDVFHQRLDPLLDDAMREFIAASRGYLTRRKRKKRRVIGIGILTVMSLMLIFGALYLAKVTKARNEARAAHAQAELNAAQAVKERTAAVAAKEEALEEKRRADESAGVARQAEAVAQKALGKTKEEKLRADREALEAKASREKAVAALAQAKAAEGRAKAAATEASRSAEEASKSERAALAAKRLADEAKADALAEKSRAERGERQQIRNLFESYLSQGILQAENGDYAAAALAMKQAAQTAGGVANQGVIPASRLELQNTVAWLTDVSRISSRRTYTGAAAPLKSVAASPDGSLLAAGGENGRIYIYGWDAGTVRQTIAAHDELVGALAFAPDGSKLITAASDRMIRFFKITTDGKVAASPSKEWRASARVGAMAVSPNGRWLVTGNEEGDVTIWNAETGGRTGRLSGHRGAIRKLAFSANGRRLASASFDRTARVWDVSARGDFREKFTSPATDEQLVSVALNADGRLAATAGLDGIIRIWNVETGAPGHRLAEHRNTVTALEFFDDGRELISASLDRTLRTWDVASGARLRVLQGHRAGVTAIARQGSLLISSGNDQIIHLWPLQADPETRDVRVLDLKYGAPQAAAISPRHDTAVVGFENGKLAGYSLPAGKLRWEIQAHQSLVSRLSFSPTGDRLASGSFDGQLKVFAITDAEPRLMRSYSNHVDVINDLAFSPDGRLLATASVGGRTKFVDGKIVTDENGSAGQVGLLDLATGELKPYAAHKGEALSVEFNAGGDRVVSSGDGGRTIVWRQLNGELTVEQRLPAGRDMIYAGRFAPDGNRVATAGRAGMLDVFDRAKNQKDLELAGHENAIMRLAFTPGGGQVITAGTDGTIRFWDLDLGRQSFALHLPVGHGNKEPLWDFAFDYQPGSGGWMAVPLTNGKLLLYRLGTVFEVPATSR